MIVDCPPTDEIEEFLEAGRAGNCIPSRSPTSKRLDRRSSITLSTSFSVAELSPPGTLEGQEQPKSLRRQPPQIGWISSHFFFRRLHVQHPVRTRTIRVVRRSGIVHLGREEALSGNGKGRGATDKNRSAWCMWGKTLLLSWSWLRIIASPRLIGLCPGFWVVRSLQSASGDLISPTVSPSLGLGHCVCNHLVTATVGRHTWKTEKMD